MKKQLSAISSQPSAGAQPSAVSSQQSAHTSGPWVKVKKRGPYGYDILHYKGEIGTFVGAAYGPTVKEATANADLVAAAPVMYEALKAARALFAPDHALSRFDWGASALRAQDFAEMNELPLTIAAAIANAEGRA